MQIAQGATLTVEAGVTVNGNGRSIVAFGKLDVEGNSASTTTLNNVRVYFGSDYRLPGRIEINHATINGGDLFPATGNGVYGSFSIKDSIIRDAGPAYVWYPTANSDFSRNVFIDSAGIGIGTDGSATVYLNDNVFIGSNTRGGYNGTASVVSWASYGNPVQVSGNSFLNTGRPALEVSIDGKMNAPNNYFGTSDTTAIENLILDRNDDLNRPSVIAIQPVSDEPTNFARSALAASGAPVMLGTGKGDTLSGTGANDTIYGGAGNDVIDGGAGNDIIEGGDGNDRIEGGFGNDIIDGGPGDDDINDKAGSDTIRGGNGNDTIRISRPNQNGRYEKVYIEAGDGNDTVFYYNLAKGSALIDLGAGDDTVQLIGSSQNEGIVLTLGAGRDTVDFSSYIMTDETVSITDFAAGFSGDSLKLEALFSNRLYGWDGSDPFAIGYARLVQSGTDTLLQVDRDSGGTVYNWFTLARLQSVSADTLTSANLSGWVPRVAPNEELATAIANTPATIVEGTNSGVSISVTLKNVSNASGTVSASLLASGTGGIDDVLTPGSSLTYGVSQSPARDYVINLPSVGVVDDWVIESDETLAFKVTANGQFFASGTNSTVVTVTLKDNDWAGTASADRMEGDAGNNYLLGLDGDDIINGNAGNDWLVGGRGHDQLNGGVGDDKLEPGEGNNVVDGGTGFDTLVLAGSKATYSVTTANGFTYLVGEEGASRLANVEQVSFAGETVAFSELATSLPALDGLRYAASHADLSAAFGTNAQAAISHYINWGFAEGRDAKGFDPLEYIASNQDLISALGSNSEAAERHYIEFGRSEGRSADSFNGLQYAASHGDLAAAYGTNTEAAARHYIDYGKAEGRSADSFDGMRYVASNPDLIPSLGSDDDAAALQYIVAGRSEGRSLDSFDALQYAASYADLAAAFGINVDAATRHFVDAGFTEGRSSDSFDGLRYIASNPDLIVAFGSDDDDAAWHYLTAGRTEGRNLAAFDAQAYAAANPDLSAIFGANTDALTEHYIDYGFFENRATNSTSDLFLV